MRCLVAVVLASLLWACDKPGPTGPSAHTPPLRFTPLDGAEALDLPFSQPVPSPALLDNRTCLIGIFPGPANLPLVHNWDVRVVGSSEQQSITIRVEARSVNENDRGTLRATLRDVDENTIASVDVAYTGSASGPTGDLAATLNPGVYRLELEAIPTTDPSPAQSGQHYTIGGPAGVELGWAGPLHYNEGTGPEGHVWAINADAREQAQLEFFVHTAGSGVPNQATEITYEVRNADGTPGPVSPTTADIDPATSVAFSFESPEPRAYLLSIVADGHHTTEKTSGDPGFYGVRCRQERPVRVTRVEIDVKPNSDPNSINLRKQGLIAVAVFTRTLEQATPQFPAFDATRLDPSQLRMMDDADFTPGIFPQGAIPLRGAIEDNDGDGDLDLVVFWKVQHLADQGFQGGRFDAATTAARLFGPVPPPPGEPVTEAVFGINPVRILSNQ